MEKQSTKKSSLDGKGGNNKTLEVGDKISDEKYRGPSINMGGWFAIVDLEDDSICNVAWCVYDAREILGTEMWEEFQDDWKTANPEYDGIDVPDEVSEVFTKRYVVVRCKITVKTGEDIW
ncbi:MAG: hypothetical protein FWB96_08275 [Defluviitaleaceae bacterium]|nr:hypothetical protein [Defluviitaleaceae bacterium]MCL2224946.1 hypothetical protein [Defluviitaleaceae bacterium]MCL2262493.1 hypothetical protein [Defluviitaleaceae bacterium]